MDYFKISLFNTIINDIDSLAQKIIIMNNEDYYLYLNTLENLKKEIELEMQKEMIKGE